MDNQTDRLKTVNNNFLNRSQRVSNFEVLRIIAMAAIIFHHYFLHSQIDELSLSPLAAAWYTALQSFGKFGVVVFIMISGYFSCLSRFSFKRLFMLWLETFFYTVLIYCVLLIAGQVDLSPSEFIANFQIILFDYWFVVCYSALVIVSPLLNILIKHLSRKQHFITCLVGTVICSVLPFFIEEEVLYQSDFTSFVFIYVFAAYIRKYGGLNVKIRTDILIIVLSVIAMLGCECFTIKIINKYINPNYGWNIFYSVQSIFVLALSAACICVAAKSKPFTNKAVNYVAKSVFGVYLIHDNIFMRNILWLKIFKVASYAAGTFPIFALHTLVTVAIVFCGCTLIDILRRFIEKPVSKVYDALSEKILRSRFVTKFKAFLQGLDDK